MVMHEPASSDHIGVCAFARELVRVCALVDAEYCNKRAGLGPFARLHHGEVGGLLDFQIW